MGRGEEEETGRKGEEMRWKGRTKSGRKRKNRGRKRRGKKMRHEWRNEAAPQGVWEQRLMVLGY